MPPPRREISMQSSCPDETEEQIIRRLARAIAILIRVSKRLEALDQQDEGTAAASQDSEDYSSLVQDELINGAGALLQDDA